MIDPEPMYSTLPSVSSPSIRTVARSSAATEGPPLPPPPIVPVAKTRADRDGRDDTESSDRVSHEDRTPHLPVLDEDRLLNDALDSRTAQTLPLGSRGRGRRRLGLTVDLGIRRSLELGFARRRGGRDHRCRSGPVEGTPKDRASDADLLAALEFDARSDACTVHERAVARAVVVDESTTVRERLDAGVPARDLLVIEDEIAGRVPSDREPVACYLDRSLALARNVGQPHEELPD